jgi:hypothetical protein
VATMITFHVPEDKDLLAAFGEVALRHEHLNYVLRMTIKSLAGLRIDEALDATTYDGSRQLRERIRRLARKRLGEGEPLLKLQALLERSGRATERRNELVHGIWAREMDGEPLRRMPDHSWQPLPTCDDLATLSQELEVIAGELNTARLDGFLSDALLQRVKRDA